MSRWHNFLAPIILNPHLVGYPKQKNTTKKWILPGSPIYSVVDFGYEIPEKGEKKSCFGTQNTSPSSSMVICISCEKVNPKILEYHWCLPGGVAQDALGRK